MDISTTEGKSRCVKIVAIVCITCIICDNLPQTAAFSFVRAHANILKWYTKLYNATMPPIKWYTSPPRWYTRTWGISARRPKWSTAPPRWYTRTWSVSTRRPKWSTSAPRWYTRAWKINSRYPKWYTRSWKSTTLLTEWNKKSTRDINYRPITTSETLEAGSEVATTVYIASGIAGSVTLIVSMVVFAYICRRRGKPKTLIIAGERTVDGDGNSKQEADGQANPSFNATGNDHTGAVHTAPVANGQTFIVTADVNPTPGFAQPPPSSQSVPVPVPVVTALVPITYVPVVSDLPRPTSLQAGGVSYTPTNNIAQPAYNHNVWGAQGVYQDPIPLMRAPVTMRVDARYGIHADPLSPSATANIYPVLPTITPTAPIQHI